MGVRFNRTAVVERDKRSEAMEFAGAISDYISENFGVEVTWGMQIGGTVGKIHWFADYTDMAHMEAILGKTMTDPGYIKLVDEAADIFVGDAIDTIVYTM